jgi:hypothetical protein
MTVRPGGSTYIRITKGRRPWLNTPRATGIGHHTAIVSWGTKTPPKVVWSPPITEEQRLAVESTEAYEDLMMSFIGEAVAEIYGTKVIYLNPDDF